MGQAELTTSTGEESLSSEEKSTILGDYELAVKSREASILGRKEVLTGKAKFGIFGDGKEIPQIAKAKFFEPGDWRAGYYRDQTLMMAIGELTIKQFFSQLYGHPSVQAEPFAAGRQMNNHFATRFLDDEGKWKVQTTRKNSSADISPVSGQMARMLGLGLASRVYRQQKGLDEGNNFSEEGNEIVFGTIGDSSTSEGIFWEALNAAGVLQIPMVLSVWDDGYGISVPRSYQTTKQSISEVLQGFQRTEEKKGLEIFSVKGWNYKELIKTYHEAAQLAREDHVPVVVHVEELTQPQGHSTSGSHERYKSGQRLEWEKEHDCNRLLRQWILEEEYATEEELKEIEEKAKKEVSEAKQEAWKQIRDPIQEELNQVKQHIDKLSSQSSESESLEAVRKELDEVMTPGRKDIMEAARKTARIVRNEQSEARREFIEWIDRYQGTNDERYDSHLYSQSEDSPLHIKETPPRYENDADKVDGRVVLRDNFEVLMEKFPETLIFGEDTGRLGGVNLGLEGLQDKFGEMRVGDTGIREASIVGQGIGMAMRGLRPIAEIQYLDYLLFAYQIMSDDLATVQYRTKGGQKAPVIVRTRGHRLEGIWHSGSPLGLIIHGMRGIHVCVPRNLTQAAGFYNTLLRGDDPALIIEPLNAYRLKEKKPSNLGNFTMPLGVPEVVREGRDITVVSYGSTLNIAQKVCEELQDVDISVELIDVRTLLPFDTEHRIVESLKKTNRVLFLDEDMPGATTGFMMQNVLDEQEGYFYLDSAPRILSAKPHRPAYGSDGDYFSKPNAEDIFDKIYAIMHEADPRRYPDIYG